MVPVPAHERAGVEHVDPIGRLPAGDGHGVPEPDRTHSGPRGELGVRTSAIAGTNFHPGAEHPFALVSPLA